jgi:tRNA nucleotidyltransferase (CCA-adding enzyme)
VSDAVQEVARLVAAAGGRALLVGGCVRDALMGTQGGPKDFDFEVYGLSPDALSAALSRRFGLDFVGASFGVIKLKGCGIDVALPRRETKLGLGHRAFETECDPFLPVEDAAARRDFTINAIYQDPLTGEIIDPWGGCADLERKVLRHVSPHFSEDPLRVLRGMQFVARFGLAPAPETIELCRGMTTEGLAQERLMGEWSKLLLQGVEISKGLEFLRATGWLSSYPELEKLVGCEQDPEWHPEGDVWNHTLQCLDAFAAARKPDDDDNLVVAFAVLCHDFGKPFCTSYDPVKGRIRSLGHDEAGAAPAVEFLKRLTNEERLLKEVPQLVRLHMRPYAMWRDKSSDGAIRRLATKVSSIGSLVKVAAADGTSPEACAWLLEQARRLEVAAAAPRPIVTGKDLIALGLKPGVEFGKILKAAYEAQLDGQFSDKSGALAYLQRH